MAFECLSNIDMQKESFALKKLFIIEYFSISFSNSNSSDQICLSSLISIKFWMFESSNIWFSSS